jgi:hypothetical protein
MPTLGLSDLVVYAYATCHRCGIELTASTCQCEEKRDGAVSYACQCGNRSYVVDAHASWRSRNDPADDSALSTRRVA